MSVYLTNAAGKLLMAPGGGLLTTPTTSVAFIPSITLALVPDDENNTVIAVMGEPPIGGVAYKLQFTGAHGPHFFDIVGIETGSKAIGTKAEVFGPYAVALDYTDLIASVVDYTGNQNPVGHLQTSPLGPGVVSYSVQPGTTVGSIAINIEALPDSGDGSIAGDDAGGALTNLWYRLDEGTTVPITPITPVAVGIVEVTGLGSGWSGILEVACASAFRSGPWGPRILAEAKEEDLPVGNPPVLIAAIADVSMTEGTGLHRDWTANFSGADTFSVSGGLTGGVSSGTGNKNYDVTAAIVETKSPIVTATNAYGSTSDSFAVVVRAAPVAPVLLTPIDPVEVPIGGTLNLNLAPHFAGTNLSFACAQAVSPFEMTAAGVLRTIAPVTTAFAPTNWTIAVTGDGGSLNQLFSMAVTAVAPAAMIVGTDVKVVRAEPAYGTRYRRGVLTFPTNLDTGAQLAWTIAEPDPVTGLVPTNKYELLNSFVMSNTSLREYQIQQSDPAKRGDPDNQDPRSDFSVFGPTDAKADKLRVARQLPGGVLSKWSAPMSVPAITTPSGEKLWLPAILRTPATLAANLVGCPGMQFQQVVERNRGARKNPALWSMLITGQDENNISVSYDDGATWMPLRMLGMTYRRMTGLYLNTDENLLVALGGSSQSNYGECGIAVSRDGGMVAPVNKLFRQDGKQAFKGVAQGATMSVNQNTIGRRPQVYNASGVAQLTDAQRPLFAVENVIGEQGALVPGEITSIYLWRSLDAAATWQHVHTFNTANYVGSGEGDTGTNEPNLEGILWCRVAENGDLVLAGRKGVDVCTNPFANANQLNFTRVMSGYIRALDLEETGQVSGLTTPARARIGMGASPWGVLESPNIREVKKDTDPKAGFQKPAGQLLPANAKIAHMSVSPFNWNKVWAIPYSSKAWVATDGAVTFKEVKSSKLTGDTSSNRYNFASRATGIYPSRGDPKAVFGHTFQTFSRSIDGGLNFDGNLVAFWDRSHTKGIGFDRSDPDKANFVQQDRGLQVAYDGIGSVEGGSLTFGRKIGPGDKTLGAWLQECGCGSNSYTSGNATMFCGPDRIMTFMNRATAGQRNAPVIVEPASGDPFGKVTVRKFAKNGTTPIGTSRCNRSWYHPDKNDAMVVGKWYISDYLNPNPLQIEFVDFSERECIGVVKASGKIYSYWVARDNPGTIFRSIIDAGGGATAIGANQTTWATIDPAEHSAPFAVGVDPDIVLYAAKGDDGRLRKVQMTKKTVGGQLVDDVVVKSTLAFDFRAAVIDKLQSAGIDMSKITMPPTDVVGIAADPNREGCFYANLTGSGVPNIWRTLDTGATWKAINLNGPLTEVQLDVWPLTGDLISSSSNGTFILPPPEPYPAMSGNKGRQYKWLEDFYNRIGKQPPHLLSPVV